MKANDNEDLPANLAKAKVAKAKLIRWRYWDKTERYRTKSTTRTSVTVSSVAATIRDDESQRRSCCDVDRIDDDGVDIMDFFQIHQLDTLPLFHLDFYFDHRVPENSD